MASPSPSQIAHYAADGFLICEGLLSRDDVGVLCRRMSEIAEGNAASFPTGAIEFEPDTDDNRSAATVRKINQCAELDDVFMAHAANPTILDVVESLIGPDIKLFGSQCFMKPPGGIQKPWHQDSAYFTIEPTELVTCWTALDDATIENGCLAFLPGSHQGRILDHDQPWIVGGRVDMQVRDEQINQTREVHVELKRGSCSFHHSRLLHRSGTNRTPNARRGLAVHYMSARSHWTHPTKDKPVYPLLRGRKYEGCV
jgi:phytanoyl-CoA hydroxylase